MPRPLASRRSISAQSPGAEQLIIRPVSFSTQRNAGMPSLEPSRIPAWLAPVWEERSVSHSVRSYPSSASQRARFGALPLRIANWSTGSARPSISSMISPGSELSICVPWRLATRRVTRIVNSSSSLVPRMTVMTIMAAATTSDESSASPKESTRI